MIVAYSGGADSAYLAWAAHSALGDHAVAITADSASLPESIAGTPKSSRAPAASVMNTSRRASSTIPIT